MILKNKYVLGFTKKANLIILLLLTCLPQLAQTNEINKRPEFFVGDRYVQFYYTDDERTTSFNIDCIQLINDPIVGTYICTLISRSYKPILGQFSEEIFSLIENNPQTYIDVQTEYLQDVDPNIAEFQSKLGIDPEIDTFIKNFNHIIYAKSIDDLRSALKDYRTLRKNGEICSVQEGRNVFMAEVNDNNQIVGHFHRRGTPFSATIDGQNLAMRIERNPQDKPPVLYDRKLGLVSKAGCRKLVWW